jgi:urease accessory protein
MRTSEPAGSSQLLRLLHFASPALPIGGFHFSQGLEQAVEGGAVTDEATALEWIRGIAEHAIGTLDMPILARLRLAYLQNEAAQVERWNARLLASRETAELREEDRHMGRSLARILNELQIGTQWAMPGPDVSYAAMFARTCAAWGVGEPETLQTYAWTWVENQTLAAVKLVPLGQMAGQRILHSLIPTLEYLASQASGLLDQEIGASTLMQTFASARHETQYTRLFRS